MTDKLKLLTMSALVELTGISKSTIYRWLDMKLYDPNIKDRSILEFPLPFKMGRAFRWKESEILEWIEKQRV